MAGLWGAEDWLGILHLGCNREVAALLGRVAAYTGFTVRAQWPVCVIA